MSHTVNILELIAELGPQTRAEIEKALGLSKSKASALMSKLSKPQATLPKRIYICRYVYDNEDERTYPRAVYDLGDLPDKKRPNRRREIQDSKRRHFEGAVMRVSSVFDLGLPPYTRYRKFSGTWLGQ